jgi:hypothetical protein
MKKIYLIMLFAVSAMLIAACGGKKNSSGPEAAVEEKAAPSENDVFTGSKDSKEAAVFCFRKNYGINFSDITPDYALGEGDKYDFYGDDGHVATATFAIAEGELSKDEYIKYVRKVYDATKKIADNGINIYGFEEKNTLEEASKEKDFDKMIEDGKGGSLFGVEFYSGMYGWSYVKDGVFYRCSMERKDKKVNGDAIPCKARVQIYKGLQKSLDDSMAEAEKMLSDPKVQEQIKKNADKEIEKALKEISK